MSSEISQQDAIDSKSDPGLTSKDQDLQQVMNASFSKKLNAVTLVNDRDATLLEARGFGVREKNLFFLKDYEVLYLMYNEKLSLVKNSKKIEFAEYVNFAIGRDEYAWTRFFIF